MFARAYGQTLRRVAPLAIGVLAIAAPVFPAERCDEGDLARIVEMVRAGLAESDRAVDGPVPSCGRAAVAALSQLLPRAKAVPDEPESGCRRTLARASAAFLEDRLREIANGVRRSKAARKFSTAARECDGGGNAEIDGVCKRAPFPVRCLRGALEGIAQSISAEPQSPNIVLVATDDQRWDTLPFMPRTTRDLAQEGLRFENSFTVSPICGPSRAALFAGRIPAHTGVHSNADAAGRFDVDTSIAVRLRGAGYATGLFGIYLAGYPEGGPSRPPGWDAWEVVASIITSHDGGFPPIRLRVGDRDEEIPASRFDLLTDRLRDGAIDFLEAREDQPFFLMLAPSAPHAPAEPTERHAGRYADEPGFRPPSFQPAKEPGKPGGIAYYRSLTKKNGAAKVDSFRRKQLESLRGVDDAVGALSEKLEELGLTDNTAFFFTSDNGHHWGEHGLNTKFTLYEEAIRVPLLLRYPRLIPAPIVSDALVVNVDLAPTFAALAGLPSEPAYDGENLMPLLRGEELDRAAITFESPGGLIIAPSRGVRTLRWKYIRTAATGGITEELYDLEADPYEQKNLARAPKHQSVREDLVARLPPPPP